MIVHTLPCADGDAAEIGNTVDWWAHAQQQLGLFHHQPVHLFLCPVHRQAVQRGPFVGLKVG